MHNPSGNERAGIIGGSGLYDLPGLTDTRWVRSTRPGARRPTRSSGTGRLGPTRLAFLPRHGRGHRIPPSEVNYRANIAALKMQGVTDVLSLSAPWAACAPTCRPAPSSSSTSSSTAPSHATKVLLRHRLVAHVSMAHPVCPRLGDHVAATLASLGVPHVRGGTYLAMEGPQFSTLAESSCTAAGTAA
jgi:5'-methylthioadenosine phosphorylase